MNDGQLQFLLFHRNLQHILLEKMSDKKKCQSFWQLCQMASAVAMIYWSMFPQHTLSYKDMQVYTIPRQMKPQAGEVSLKCFGVY